MVKLRDGAVIFPQGYDFEPFKSVTLTLSAPIPVAPIKSVSPAASVPQPPIPEVKSAPCEATPSDPKTPAAEPVAPPAAPPEKRSESQPGAPRINELNAADSSQAGAAKPSVQERKEQSKRDKQRNKQKASQPQSDADTATESEQVSEQKPAAAEGAPALGADVSPTAEKLLASLKRSNAWLLSEVMAAYREGKLTGRVAALPYGLGISNDELNAHGIPVMELLEELGLKAWLWQDKVRSSRRIHSVEIDGVTHRMVILKPDVAAGLGFDMTVEV